MNRSLTLALAGLFVSLIATTSQGAVLYFDDFDGANVPLFGTTPDVTPGGETWSGSSDDYQANGNVQGTNEDGVWLPFTPQAGRQYILSAEIDTNTFSGPGSDATDWITLGFAANNGDNIFNSGGVDGYGTLLVRTNRGGGQGQAFAGAQTAGGALGVATPAGPVDIDIVLDTDFASPASWTMEWFIGGSSVAGPVTVGSGTYADIAYVGFTRLDGAGGTIDNFQLQEVLDSPVPEPSTSLLVCLGLGLVASRRRLRAGR